MPTITRKEKGEKMQKKGPYSFNLKVNWQIFSGLNPQFKILSKILETVILVPFIYGIHLFCYHILFFTQFKTLKY